MNSRERFHAVMAHQACDRPPLFEEGIRPEVLRRWRRQGFTQTQAYGDVLAYDAREEIEPDLDPRPELEEWPTDLEGLDREAWRFDPYDQRRMPGDWNKIQRATLAGEAVLMLRAHQGFFLSMGVGAWQRFRQVALLCVDQPRFVERVLALHAGLAATLAERILSAIRLDAVIFSEPISGNHGSLISPKMYRNLILPHYQPVMEVFRRHKVETVIIRTYANSRRLLPALVEAGFTCLWACECPYPEMDYRAIRAEFGPTLRLIGGLDSDVLRGEQDGIDRLLTETAAPLLEQGGYIPLLDGRVRKDIPFQNYLNYRRKLLALVKEYR